MQITADTLPNDLDALRALALGLQQKLAPSDAEVASLTAERDALAKINALLEYYLARLRRLKFGKSSERMDADKLQLALEDTEQPSRRRSPPGTGLIAAPAGRGRRNLPLGGRRFPITCRSWTSSSSPKAHSTPAAMGPCM